MPSVAVVPSNSDHTLRDLVLFIPNALVGCYQQQRTQAVPENQGCWTARSKCPSPAALSQAGTCDFQFAWHLGSFPSCATEPYTAAERKKKGKIEKKIRFYSSCGEEAGLFSSTVSLSGTDSKRWKKKRQDSRQDSVLCSGYN